MLGYKCTISVIFGKTFPSIKFNPQREQYVLGIPKQVVKRQKSFGALNPYFHFSKINSFQLKNGYFTRDPQHLKWKDERILYYYKTFSHCTKKYISWQKNANRYRYKKKYMPLSTYTIIF